ncbi:ABC transporter permease [uncultured Clostridium sp.]|uniref:ABC transporter permease n=1 Tax=uncultured Clostridium sp. TaxID=59620 RepID=UPI0028E9F069|nr:ABC transporter permease [uncultured Clostridium sp.]
MSFSSILKSEFLKYKKGAFWKISFIVPLISFLMLFGDWYYRADYLTSGKVLKKLNDLGVESKWQVILFENHMGMQWNLLLILVISLIAAIVNHIEYSENSWKTILSKPVERYKIYMAKWIVIFIVTLISILLNSLGIIFIGKILKIEESLKLNLFIKYIVLQTIGVMAIISLQQFISCFMKNSIVAACIGFCGGISAYMFYQGKIISKIVPYTYTFDALPFLDASVLTTFIVISFISSAFWITLGIIKFKKVEV